MKIGRVDTDKEVLVIAEVGNNHEGSFDAAQRLVREAARCGAQAVKFQTFRTELFTGPADPVRIKRLKSFELSHEQFSGLARLAREEGLLFISTPLDLESARFLNGIVDALKISSGDNNFVQLLDLAASFDKPLLLSTGLAAEAEVRAAVERLLARRTPADLAVLHCVTAYPVPDAQANVSAVARLARALPCAVGYSDHTLGVDAALAAVALGARVVEKHFTLDKNTSDFRDHQLSADPAEMADLVRRVKRVSALLGTGEKTVQDCERPFLTTARRSIAAGRDMAAGETLTMKDLLWLRPGDGLAPGREGELVGKKLRWAVKRGEVLLASHVGGA